MTPEEQIKNDIVKNFEDMVSNPERTYHTNDTIPYFMVKILDMLEVVDSRLEAILADLDDEWNTRHNH